jgi:hypothetical protein
VGEKRVLFAVTLITDEGQNVVPMRLSPDSPLTEIAWDGVSTLKYTSVLRSGNKVTGNFTCMHEPNAEEDHTLELCVALTFHPHGWVRFERSTLILNREDELRLHIPLSVCEQNMFRNALALPDIEKLYGKSLADKQAEDTWRAVATYRELPWAHRPSRVGQRSLPTLARVKEDTLRAEARLIAETLEPKWKERLGMLVVSLLRNRERTRTIIRQWHAYPMFQNRKSHEIWSLFMEAVLYSPLRLQITQHSLFLFQEPALAIPLTWLNADERIIATEMVKARTELFRSVSESRVTAQYTCKDCRLDGMLDKLLCRNLIVHVFVIDCVARATLVGRERPTLLLVTISAAGHCYVKHKHNRFLYHLKRALERRTLIQDVAQMGQFVQIGDCIPAYTYQAPDRTQAARKPRWTPK